MDVPRTGKFQGCRLKFAQFGEIAVPHLAAQGRISELAPARDGDKSGVFQFFQMMGKSRCGDG
jgi:hypothetical protein